MRPERRPNPSVASARRARSLLLNQNCLTPRQRLGVSARFLVPSQATTGVRCSLDCEASANILGTASLFIIQRQKTRSLPSMVIPPFRLSQLETQFQTYELLHTRLRVNINKPSPYPLRRRSPVSAQYNHTIGTLLISHESTIKLLVVSRLILYLAISVTRDSQSGLPSQSVEQ
jgi:hypothetical protein